MQHVESDMTLASRAIVRRGNYGRKLWEGIMAIEKTSLGAAIKHVRAIRGMTQIHLAKAAGLSDGGKSLALIEQGRRSVSIETLNAIARAPAIPPACLTVLGSTRIGNNRAATALMKD